jgi:photosystem II stability/assembly factor-like uncharacterized protein
MIYVGSAPNGAGKTRVFRSGDDGATWTRLTDSSWSGNLTSITVAPNGDVFAIIGMVLYRSTDNGGKWDSIATSGTSFHTVAVTAAGTIFTAPGYAEGITRSTDGGASWKSLTLPEREIDVYSIVAAGGDTIYAGTDGWWKLSFIRSIDNGETWSRVDDMPNVNRLALKGGGMLFASTSQNADTLTPCLYRSIDFGSTWSPASLKNVNITSLATNARGDLFAGMRENLSRKTTLSGLYRSNDNGETWSPMNVGIIDTNVTTVAITGRGYAIVGTDHGLYRSVASTLDVPAPGLPAAQATLECLPNPFAANASIRFTLAEPGQVRLSILNALGQEIAAPIDGRLEVGPHATTFDSQRLPAGAYYCRLSAGGHTTSMRIVSLH